MDLLGLMPAFVVAVLLISASPGPAMALILRRAAAHGWRAALPTVLGLELGLYLWALLAAAGFAALVAVSQTAFVVLKVVGAAVLVYLGVRAWLSAWHGGGPEDAEVGPAGGRAWWRSFGEGVVVQLANPKAAVFMVAFYPQFVPADRPLFATTAGLAVVQVMIETIFYLGLAHVGRVGAVFRSSRVRRRIDAVLGTVLVGLGVRVALLSR